MLNDIQAVRALLLDWYDKNRRELPWRSENADPYRVWLSEVMLQQTRVDTVRAYYIRWLERFPDLQTLAAAHQDEVLKAWEGLGYYSRARNFHAAVREVSARYGGEVPPDRDCFRQLPGVGRYTVGAVMSIAFGLPEPIVDGNVRRVFARLLDLPAPSDSELWENAAAIVPGDRPGELNQALMELGATVCTPRAPACARCPVAAFCLARFRGTERDRPLPRAKAPIPTEEHASAVVLSRGKVLIVRRPEGGRLAGMWEFPGAELQAGEGVEAGAARAALQLAGIAAEPARTLGSVTHVFSHVKVNYHAVLMHRSDDLSDGTKSAIWLLPDEIGQFALSKAQQRILAIAAEHFAPEDGGGRHSQA